MGNQDMQYQGESSLTSPVRSTENTDLPMDKVPGRTRKKAWRINWRRLGSWLCTWEVYPIMLAAGFLRFYQINASEFDPTSRQCLAWRMTPFIMA